MPNEKFNLTIDKFEGINLFDSSNDLRPGECTDLRELVVQGRRLKMGNQLSTTNLPQDSSARWMKIWADSNDTWYIMLALDDSTNTDLKHYSGATWQTSATFTDLFASDKTSTPDSYTVGGDLRIGGSITNYHKFITRQASTTYRFGRASGDSDANGLRAAGLYMQKGEIAYPNENSEISSFTSTNQDSGYDFIEGDTVEYGLSYTYDNAQESLLRTGTTDTLTAGQRTALYLKVIPPGTTLWRITHVNIYRALNGSDFYLLTRIQVKDTGGSANYGELGGTANWAWTDDSGSGYGEITVYDTGAVLTNSYTSITGYPDFTAHDGTTLQNENNLKVYFKVCTVCQGRAVVGNVKRAVGEGTETYNDRLYFSQVGRFDSFYKTDWVDLETGDGDQITALLEFGNEIVVFKQNNMYIWNMGTRDELNWYRRSAYRGYGVQAQKNAYSTPYGIAFSNDNGIYLYRGQGEPEEVSRKIKGNFTGDNIAIGYDTINRRIMGFEDAGFLYLIDLDDGFIAKRSGFGSLVIGAFDVYDNDPYMLETVGDQVYNVNGTAATLSGTLAYQSGDMNFGTDRNKRIKRVKIGYKATTGASPTITFGVSSDLGSNYTSTTLATSTNYKMVEYFPEIYGRHFRFRITWTASLSGFELDLIEISGKVYRV